MSEVKRFGFGLDGPGFRQCSDGCYVLISDFDRVTAERDAAIEDRNAWKGTAETFEDFYRKTEVERDAALEEVEALKHWRDLALQFDNHRMKALWHLKTLVSDGAHYDAAAAFLTEPPIPASELQQRLTAADERADVLESALRELLAGTGNSPGANRKYGRARAVLAGSQKQAAPEPYQGIPGTSFQRLNALANQGE